MRELSDKTRREPTAVAWKSINQYGQEFIKVVFDEDITFLKGEKMYLVMGNKPNFYFYKNDEQDEQ